jgi:EmrB/QacA subfamily drug resistance transporter
VADSRGATQRLTLPLVGAGAFLSSLDLFIVNIAFPDIRADFPGTTNAGLSWVLNGYGIVFAALLVPAGRLADLYGRRRLFRLGMLLFALASAGCAVAPSVGLLVLGRVVQAAGAALMVPTSLGLLLAAYPASAHRRVVGLWAAIGSTAAASGPVLGGLLVQADWRWIFLVNLPAAVPAVLLGRRLPETRHHEHGGLPDLVGAAVLALGIAGLVAAISNASAWGIGDPKLWACLVIGALSLVLFARRCARHPRPVIDPHLLRIREFTAATAAMGFFYAGFGVMLLGGTLFLSQAWHQSSVAAGLEFAPGPLAATLGAVLGSRIPGPRRTVALVGATLFVLAGLWQFAALGDPAAYAAHFLPASILSGAGVGLSQTAIMTAGAAVLPEHRYATGTGVLNTSRQIGSALGVAVLVSLLGTGATAADYRAGWLVMAGCGVLAVLFALRLAARPQGAVAEVAVRAGADTSA